MRILAKITVFIILFFFVVCSGVFWLLNSGYFYTHLVPRMIRPALQGARITEIQYGSHMFRLPCRFLLKNIRIKAENTDLTADFSVPEFYAEYTPFSPVHELKIYVKDLKGKLPPCEIESLNFNGWMRFDFPQGPAIEGNLAIKAADFYNFTGTRILAVLKGREGRLELFRAFADSYDGTIGAEIFLDYLAGMSYSIKLKLKEVNLRKMRSAYPDVFSQIDGRLSGDVSIQGKGDKIDFLKADLDIPAGGKLKASLLGFIAQYLPQSTQKKELELLIAANGEVPFENGILSLQSLSDDQLATTVALKSQKFNLDMNVGVDVNLEGGFQNLFRYMQKAVKQ